MYAKDAFGAKSPGHPIKAPAEPMASVCTDARLVGSLFKKLHKSVFETWEPRVFVLRADRLCYFRKTDNVRLECPLAVASLIVPVPDGSERSGRRFHLDFAAHSFNGAQVHAQDLDLEATDAAAAGVWILALQEQIRVARQPALEVARAADPAHRDGQRPSAEQWHQMATKIDKGVRPLDMVRCAGFVLVTEPHPAVAVELGAMAPKPDAVVSIQPCTALVLELWCVEVSLLEGEGSEAVVQQFA